MSEEFHEMDEDQLWEALKSAEGYDRADVLRHLATWRNIENDHTMARQLLEESCEIFGQLSEAREAGVTRIALAGTYSDLDEHHLARQTLLSAADFLQLQGLDKEMGDCYFYAAVESRTLNEYGIAAEYMARAEQFYASAGTPNPQGVASAGRELGWLLQHIGGRDDEALAAFERAIDISKGECPAHFVNDIRERYMTILCDLHKFDEALIQARQALAVCRACGCGYCIISSLMDMGYAYSRLKDPYLATVYYQEGYDLAKASNNLPMQLRAKIFFAENRMKSEPLHAHQMINECIDLAQALGHDVALANAYRCLGRINLKEERFDDAAEYFGKAATIWSKKGELANVATLQRSQARAFIRGGKSRNALQVIRANAWVDRTGFIRSTDLADHMAVYALALLADDQKEAALERAEWILQNMDLTQWFHVQGMAHEVRAYALRHRDPQVSDRAAQRAISSYVVANYVDSAQALAVEFVIDPYLVLQKIDIDNLERAQNEQARAMADEDSNVYVLDFVATMGNKDPITAQVEELEEAAKAAHEELDDESGTGTTGPISS